MVARNLTLSAVVGLFGICALILTGCGGGTSLTQPFGTNPNDTNKERAVNALVGVSGGAIDIAQRGTNLNATPLAFGQVTSYATVSSGLGVDTLVYQSGTQSQVTSKKSVDMSRNFLYTVIAAGVSGGTGVKAPQLIQVIDNIPTITGNTAALRVINLAPDSTPLSLYNTSGTPPSATPITGLTAVAYPNQSSFNNVNYVVVPAAIYNLSVRDNVGNAIPSRTNTSAVTLVAGHAYTLFLVGLVNSGASGQPFDVTVAQDF